MDVDEVSAHAVDKQDGHITVLNRQSCGPQGSGALSIDPTGPASSPPVTTRALVGIVPNHRIFSRKHLGGHPCTRTCAGLSRRLI